MVKIEPYFHKSITYFLFLLFQVLFLEVYIFEICKWAPINMNFFVFNT
jgi:hypothetical protein